MTLYEVIATTALRDDEVQDAAILYKNSERNHSVGCALPWNTRNFPQLSQPRPTKVALMPSDRLLLP